MSNEPTSRTTAHGDLRGIASLFDELVSLSPEDRLQRLEGISAPLRLEVERLLAADAEALQIERANPGPDALVGSTIKNYLLVDKLGEGGMGVVYRAKEEGHLDRVVAIKVVKAGMDTQEVVGRFSIERQALAVMTHPNIARIYEAGATETGKPYFVMEYVDGAPIDEFCDAHRLSIPERLELFQQVCQAVQHAHQKGIIHRDLKPSNVLVSKVGGVAVPKIIDFGIAKAIASHSAEDAGLTSLGQWVGTMEYMSPEQFSWPVDIDTRTDVFTLGVLLYELLVGVRPLDSSGLSYEEFLRLVKEEEPLTASGRVRALASMGIDRSHDRGTDPRSWSRTLRGELDWILSKAMAKDRESRYVSAAEFASDLQRYNANEPVLASQRGFAYPMKKFVRRHHLGVGVVAATLVLTVAFVATLVAQREEIAKEAETSEQIADFLVGLFYLDGSADTPSGDLTAKELLDRGEKSIRTDLASQPEIRARLTAAIGEAYFGLGLYGKSDRMLTLSLRDRRETLGVDHPETLATAHDLLALRAARRESRNSASRERNLSIFHSEHEAPSSLSTGFLERIYDRRHEFCREAKEYWAGAELREGRRSDPFPPEPSSFEIRDAPRMLPHLRSLAKRDETPENLYRLGRAELAAGLHHESLRTFERLRSMEEPPDPWRAVADWRVQYHIGYLYLQAEETDLAMKALRDALPRSPQGIGEAPAPMVLNLLGKAHEKSGNYCDAMVTYELSGDEANASRMKSIAIEESHDREFYVDP